MRLREFFIATALMTLPLVTVRAFPVHSGSEPRRYSGDNSNGSNEAETLPAAPSSLIYKDKVLGSAYYDTLRILNVNSPCSDFFGGPSAAVEVFNSLMGRIRKHRLSPGVGIRMSGSSTSVIDVEKKFAYRIFDEVSINTDGPFYRKKFSDADLTVPGIGTFLANSREVRVLMFLHEIGHLIKGPLGKWLLPDDGKSEDLSRANSQKIEDLCGEQIRGLSKLDAPKLAKLKKPEAKLTLASTLSLSRH